MLNCGKLVRATWVTLALCLTVSSASPGAKNAESSAAAGRSAETQALLESLEQKSSGEAPRISLDDQGFVTFLGAPPGNAFVSGAAKSAAPEDAARSFLEKWSGNFTGKSANIKLSVTRVKPGAGRTSVRFAQTYNGLDVYGAEIIVHVGAGGGIEMATAKVLHNTAKLDSGKLTLKPEVSRKKAAELALQQMSQLHEGAALSNSAPELKIYCPALLGKTGETALVWVFEVLGEAPGRVDERVFVDAHTGKILLHYTLVENVKNRTIYDSANTTANPGTLVRSEGNGPVGLADANFAYDYFGDTYDFYFDEHGRDSIDGAGITMSATVRYCDPNDFCPTENAFWSGNQNRMYFGDGFAAADDVVGHELTHGVTQYESNLDYINQSGAINESISDMWGEWIDQTNVGGTDSSDVRWQLGEDVPGFGVIRDMKNPPTYGDPDRMGSPFFYTGSGDNGGVHTNSGVGNKLCYLLTDGDVFNGRTITAMGISAAADLFYECQTNLLIQTSDYAGLYNAVTQAAINLGLSQGQRDNIEQACLAVEIKPLPARTTGFAALSSTSSTDILLLWTNPIAGGFQNVVIRRSTTSYPLTPSDGTLVYQGTASSVGDLGLVQDTTYYYSIFAYYGGSSYSYPNFSAAVAGQNPPSYFTENFTAADNDMDNRTVVFTPNNSLDQYRMCADTASDFPTDPSTGTLILPGDDGSIKITLSGGAHVQFYGHDYTSFYVNGNGNITFGAPSDEFLETLDDHFGLPRISGLFDDLNTGAGGSVRWQQFADRVVVTFQGVPEYGTLNSNNFQIEMCFDGTIQMTWLGIAATDGLVGISAGQGKATNFTETDLSDWDSDSDLLPNCWEVDFGLDPENPFGDDGGTGDPDLDGLTNSEEYQNGADPSLADTDGDSLNDGIEFHTYGTDPALADTDGDGFSDGEEVTAATEPLSNTSYPTTLLWTDFAYLGTETGAFSLPFNTIAEAVNKVSTGGIVRVKGNSTLTHLAGSIRITKALLLQSSGGTVSIGK